VEEPSFAVRDGSDFSTQINQGTDRQCTAEEPCWHFFFHPPLVPTPAEFHGPFNPYLRPNVIITRLPSDGTGEPVDASLACVAEYGEGAVDTVRAFSPDEISMSIDNEVYSVGWQTSRDDLTSGTGYRICVRLGYGAGAVDLGYRDVQPDDSGADRPRNPEQQPIMQFNNGSNLPIKFRIETGLFCKEGADCGEASIGSGGGTVLTTGKTAALQVNPDALSGEYVVVVEEIKCPKDAFGVSYLDINNPQFPGCYDISTVPPVTSLGDAGAIVGVCYAGPQALWGVVQLHHEMANRQVEALARVEPPSGLYCEDYVPMSATMWDRAMLLARQGWRSVQTNVSPWFSPAPLAASHHGFGGGELEAFSPVSWAVPASMELVGQNEFEGVIDQELTPQVQITRITENHPNIPSEQPPLEGATVDWEVTSPSGWIKQVDGSDYTDFLEVGTGSDGIGQVTWKLGPGWNILTASGYGIGCTSYANCDVVGLSPQPAPGPFPPDHHVEGAVVVGKGEITFRAYVPVPLIFFREPTDVMMDSDGLLATLSEFVVCSDPRVEGVEISDIKAVNNNGSWVELSGFSRVYTDESGCVTFTDLQINKTGAYRLVVNPVYDSRDKVVDGDAESEKFNVKPFK